jgi:hypothetical protein
MNGRRRRKNMNDAQTANRSATDAYAGYHAAALETLEEIREAIEGMPAPGYEGFEPNWGHVGDLATLARELAGIRDRLAAGEV